MGAEPEHAAERVPRSGLCRLPVPERVVALVVAAGIGLVLLLAFLLTPDPRGMGTHEQLGFAPCMTEYLFGIPCPMCGMTTSFAEMAHGHILRAFVVQPAGAVLFVITALVGFGSLFTAATGLYPASVVSWMRSKRFWWGAVAFVAAAWVYKIVVGAV